MVRLLDFIYVRAAILAVCYWLTVKIAVELVYPASKIALFWPPNAIAAAVLIFSPRRHWPIYMIAMASAYFAARVPGGQLPLFVYVVFCVANITEVLVVSTLLRVFTSKDANQDALSKRLFVSVLGAVPASFISAMMAGAAVSVGVDNAVFWKASLGWFTGDLSGLLLTLPALLAWFDSGRRPLKKLMRENGVESLLLIVILVGVGVASATYTADDLQVSLIFPYLVFPLLIWAGLRLGARVSTLAILVVGLSAVLLTLKGNGPFSYEGISSFAEVVLMKVGLITIAMTTLVLVSVVSARQKAEIALGESEQRHRLFIENVEEGVVVIKNGKIVDISDVWLSMFGVTQEEVIGRSPLDYTAASMRGKADQYISEGFEDTYESEMLRGDGTTFPALVRGKQLLLSGSDVRFVTVLDISAQKETEAALIAAKRESDEANRAKSDFLSTMSHELRTPMNAILGFGQMLDLNPKEPLSVEQKNCVDHIMAGGKHLLELIDQVLDLAKIEAGKMTLSLERVDLNTLCRECLSLIDNQAEKRGLRIDSELGEAISVKADYTRLKQVLLNLLSNAVKYNRNGGTVTLACVETPDNMIRVLVSDTGEGISEEDQACLFEPFNRLGKESGEIEGTGIGLTVTKQLIEAMGGKIGVESERGKGSSFWIEIPAVRISEKKTAEPIEVIIPNDSGDNAPAFSTILYIEDNPANLQLMETIIGRIGEHTLVSAHTAELGLTIAEEQLPDLILMDINLPGMDGIAAMKVLSTIEATKDIPVIAISAAAMKSDIDKGMAAGFRDYLTKPFNVSEVIAAIEKELGV